MPDHTDLDGRLAGGRAALLADIEAPPLERIGARAAGIRRRRRARQAASGVGAALAVVALVTFLVRPQAGDPAPRVAAPPPPNAPVYAGDGLTINGLPDLGAALDLPGTVVGMEFVDPEHGYAVSACGTGDYDCRPSFGVTDDGGRTWSPRRLPAAVDADATPELVAFAPPRVLIRAGGQAWTSADAGRTWQPATIGDQPVLASAGDRLRPGGAGGGSRGGCPGGRVHAWAPILGPRGPLRDQPDLDVCAVVPAGGGDRAWWAGGAADGHAAVAVTRDRGRTWQEHKLPGYGTAKVAVLGPHVYALVCDASGRLTAVHHSADSGATFTQTGSYDLPAGVAGDPVALLDGRLLLVDPGGNWWFSRDDGHRFTRAGGTLPTVGRLARTSAGYVAYDLFHSGWLAFSTDGATWRKQELR